MITTTTETTIIRMGIIMEMITTPTTTVLTWLGGLEIMATTMAEASFFINLFHTRYIIILRNISLKVVNTCGDSIHY